MFPTLRTSRLLLSQIDINDAEVILFLRSNPEVIKYILRDPYTEIQQAIDFIEMITKQFENKESVTWALRNPESNEMMGSICFWNFSEDRKTAEMGYDMKPQFQGKGFMDEAMKTIIDFGFTELGLVQIEAFTSQYNNASKKVLFKNNFVQNPLRKDSDNPDNQIFELKKN